MNIESVMKEYQEKLGLWAQFLSRLTALIEDLMRDNPSVYSVHARIKAWPSVAQKLAVLDTSELSQIRDIVGVRILVYQQEDVTTMVRLLKERLEVIDSAEQVWSDEPRYQSVHLWVEVGKERQDLPEWHPFRGLRAEIQVRTLLASAWQELEHHLRYKVSIDTPVATKHRLAISEENRLDNIIDQFEVLLEKPKVHEKREIHSFIRENSFILHPNPQDVWSETAIGLGTEYRVDFLICEADGSYILVEIENPRNRLFTRNGDFSAALNHAQRQIEDWQEWIENNLSTVEKKFPGMSSPRGLLVIGRSKDLSEVEQRRLARRNINLRGRLMIRTYDDLIANARAFIASIRKHLQR